MIESTSLLLVALAKSYKPTDPSDMLLLHFFQAIVYCEPVLSSLNHLSEFLNIISENQASNICNRFCMNEANNVMSTQRYKIHRFSIDTCPLQVLSCLLQIAFQPYGSEKTPTEHTDEVATVANITVRMLQFLRNCFTRRTYIKKWNEESTMKSDFILFYFSAFLKVLIGYFGGTKTEMMFHKYRIVIAILYRVLSFLCIFASTVGWNVTIILVCNIGI